MKKDIGFWNEQGEYIPDIQEVSEVEMDKEIIIDGVDVAGCKYYLFRDKQSAGERSCGVGLIDCNGQDCIYKRFKRLQQENEKFINVTNDSIIEQEKQVARINCLEQENEQLEKENKVNLSRSLDLNREIQNLSAENAELKAENERLKEEKGGMQILIDSYITLTEKYHQTLQEIKAIAESAMAKQQEYKKDFEQIIDLITKAEEE